MLRKLIEKGVFQFHLGNRVHVSHLFLIRQFFLIHDVFIHLPVKYELLDDSQIFRLFFLVNSGGFVSTMLLNKIFKFSHF